jgi:large-conductance mechanosensitive channel
MKKGRLIAPVVVAALTALYFCFYLCLLWTASLSPLGKWLGIVILLALIGVMVFVLVERINEIRSGEEDDLDNY